jgi:hypothetical protein
MRTQQELDDAAAALWAQRELEEREQLEQRRQREDAALRRCRPLMDELRQMIDSNRNRKPT